MKKCPYCSHTLNFIQFLTGYGSDTLFKHPSKAHAHEHLCLNCHKMVWIHYDRDLFAQRFRQSLILHVIFSAVVTFLGVRPVLDFTLTQSFFFMMTVMLCGGAVITSYARYESASLKMENTPHA